MGFACFQSNQQHLLAVGYQNSEALSGFNYYTPIFRDINAQVDENGTKLMDIQEIQMDDTVPPMGANLQRRGTGGKPNCYYLWANKQIAKMLGLTDGSKGAWMNEDRSKIEPAVMLKEGDSVQIDTGINVSKQMMNAGQVSDDDITYKTVAGFNYVGNAFPGTLDIQDIQMDDTVPPMGANLQRRGTGGKPNCYYLWANKQIAKMLGLTDGSKGAWMNEDRSKIEPAVILNPGESVQIDTGMNVDKIATVLAPIEL